MSKSKAPPKQELLCQMTDVVNHHEDALDQFSGCKPFPKKFHVLEVERGKWRHLEELERKVLKYTTLEAVQKEICNYCTQLPPSFKYFKFDAAKSKEAAQFWSMQDASAFNPKILIAPVLEASQPGYTHHRLDFDAHDMSTPLFDSFMAHVETNQEALLAFIGGLFDPKFPRQFYLWLTGPGGDGKGTLLHLLAQIFGDAYTSLSSDPRQQNQFYTSSLVGKRIAAFQDCINPRVVQSEIFMQITGGDDVRIEEKGLKAYNAKIDAMVIVSSNLEPALTSSEAHQRRAVICQMRKRDHLDGPKSTYRDRLWEERAGILWKCKEAWRKMREEHGDFVAQTEVARNVAEEYETKWASLLERYFVLNLNNSGILRCNDFHTIMTERAKLNDFEIGDFKRYLQRRGVNTNYRGRTGNEPRTMRFLHLKDNNQAAHLQATAQEPNY